MNSLPIHIQNIINRMVIQLKNQDVIEEIKYNIKREVIYPNIFYCQSCKPKLPITLINSFGIRFRDNDGYTLYCMDCITPLIKFPHLLFWECNKCDMSMVVGNDYLHKKRNKIAAFGSYLKDRIVSFFKRN